jgi:peptidyl-prolyl cis-trans isomerase-like 4
MSVLLKTNLGELVIDLYVKECPLTCKNFLKLCKIDYYNNCLFHNIQPDFLVQTGNRENKEMCHTSIYGLLYGEQNRFFDDEIRPTLKHIKKGTVSMASITKNSNGSTFFITLSNFPLASLDFKHTVFGKISKGFDTLERINESSINMKGVPLKNIMIKQTLIMNDPYPDLPGTFKNSIMSSLKSTSSTKSIEDYWMPQYDLRSKEEINDEIFENESRSRAILLEMVGDIPSAEIRPPKNVLFICNLNSVTTEWDLEVIFCQFGKVLTCEIIRDWKNGESLKYGFIEFDNSIVCEIAYFKMNNVVIDERRVKVDFSQSVATLWKRLKKEIE